MQMSLGTEFVLHESYDSRRLPMHKCKRCKNVTDGTNDRIFIPRLSVQRTSYHFLENLTYKYHYQYFLTLKNHVLALILVVKQTPVV